MCREGGGPDTRPEQEKHVRARSGKKGGGREISGSGAGGRERTRRLVRSGAAHSTTSIFDAVRTFLPSSSLTSPVALTFFTVLQMLPWKSLLTLFLAR